MNGVSRVKIKVFDRGEEEELERLGLNKEREYEFIPFNFLTRLFVGYWIDPKENEICFYLGSEVKCFYTENTDKNQELFQTILKENAERN